MRLACGTVTGLNHETFYYTVKSDAVVKTAFSKFDEVVAVKRSEIGKRYYNFSFGGL